MTEPQGTPGAPGPHPMMKGALLSVPLLGQSKMVRFQYNPETLTRSVKPSFYTPSQGQRSGSPRFAGAPTQSLQLEILVDATEGLDANDPETRRSGIMPQLAALELLAYPSLAQIAINTVTLAIGTVEALPIVAPRILFVFGTNRVLPVRLTGLELTEEFFDNRLNPIRARAQISMDVLSYSDVFLTDPSWFTFLDYQIGLESTASFQSGPTAVGGLLLGSADAGLTVEE